MRPQKRWGSVLLIALLLLLPLEAKGAEQASSVQENLPRHIPLNGEWSFSVRYRRKNKWSRPLKKASVQVPGYYRPDFKDSADKVEMTFVRPISVPVSWQKLLQSGYHALVEFDSVDYHAAVSVVPEETNVSQPLISHSGYIGRFAHPLPASFQRGKLQVTVQDMMQHNKTIEAMARASSTSIQGGEDLGKNFNRSGIVEPCRLRLTGPVYLRNAFAGTIKAGRRGVLRLGAELIPLLQGSLRLKIKYRVMDRQSSAVISRGEFPLEHYSSKAGQAFEFLRNIDINMPSTRSQRMRVEISVLVQGKLSDSRTVEALNRRFDVSQNRIRMNGKPVFLKGAALHVMLRILPFGRLPKKAAYFPDDAQIDRRLEFYADSIKAANVDLVRAALVVPIRKFHKTMARKGLLLYQDFPLTFNIDYQELSPAEILRQFDEFLWRVSAEPSVVIIALHNEAEIGDTSSPDRRQTHDLIEKMLKRAEHLAPHLLRIGCSGCNGKAVFDQASVFSVQDQLNDQHHYLGHRWRPLVGHHQLREIIFNEIGAGSRKPVFWSELSGGWLEHFSFLMRQDPSSADSRLGDFPPITLGPNKFSIRQFYALVHCIAEKKAAKPDLHDCVSKQDYPDNEPLLIRTAKRYFLAGRDRVLLPAPKDQMRWAKRFTADWLATQLYEARVNYHSGGSIVGTSPWDPSLPLGFPISLAGLQPSLSAEELALHDSRKIISAAYAPLAVYSRPARFGEDLEVILINDGEKVRGVLTLEIADKKIYSRPMNIAANSLTRTHFSLNTPAFVEVQNAALRLSVNGKILSEYVVVLDGAY